jgi:hypothetical protein
MQHPPRQRLSSNGIVGNLPGFGRFLGNFDNEILQATYGCLGTNQAKGPANQFRTCGFVAPNQRLNESWQGI